MIDLGGSQEFPGSAFILACREENLAIFEVNEVKSTFGCVAHVWVAKQFVKSGKGFFFSLSRTSRIIVLSFLGRYRNQCISSLKPEQVVARILGAQLSR